jgi:hypothetical protein
VPDAFFTYVGYNGYTPNKLLADMIPATTFAVGSNSVAAVNGPSSDIRNINLNLLKSGGANGRWPAERDSKSWTHGDLRSVSYFFTCEAYKQLVVKGDLK